MTDTQNQRFNTESKILRSSPILLSWAVSSIPAEGAAAANPYRINSNVYIQV